MRIVHVVLGKANPERANGVNRVVHGLATAQARAGADVTVLGITGAPDAPTPAREYGLELYTAQPRPWRLDPRLERALERASGSVFHLHGGYHLEFHAVARRLHRRRTPWVFTPHGAYRRAVLARPWLAKRAYVALFDGFVLAGARAVHVFSDREARELGALHPRARTVVLQNGVDAAELRVDTSAGHGLLPVFGFCGRLDARAKGLDLLLDGFALWIRRGGEGELRLLGDGPDRGRLLRRAERLEIADRVRSLGCAFGTEKLRQIAAFDVFLHPSRNEGMPIAVLEAAALGLPCVVSRETNLGEAIEAFEAGIVLERNDPARIAEALERCAALRACGDLPALGARARGMIAAEFDWARIARRSFAALYGIEAAEAAQAA